MRRALLVLLLSTLAAFTISLRSAAVPSRSPSALPDLPAQAPPRIQDGPLLGSGPVFEYDLPVGWTLFSFPLARLEGARGFQHAIYRWTPRGWQAYDPVNAPRSVDTGYAYVAWSDEPTRVQVRGPVAPPPRTLQLRAGWNMVGCPAQEPIPWAQVSLTGAGGVTRCVAEASSSDRVQTSSWLYAMARVSPAGRNEWLDLRTTGAQLLPGEDTWIFAWEDVVLNWNDQAPRAGAPHIDAARADGIVVDIRGRGFGPQGAGVVTVDSVAMRPQDILSWTDTQIRFRVPYETLSGPLCVLVNRFPSNVVSLALPHPTERGGTLKGQIETSGGRPLANAQIMLDTGQIAVSDANGKFRLDGIPAGTYTAHITRLGYNAGKGTVRVEAGKARRLLVSLSPQGGVPAAAPPQEPRGTLWVEAYRYRTGEETRFVHQIQVTEYGDSRHQWRSVSWSTDAQSRSLQCTRVPLERTYAVKVTWTDARGNETSSTTYRKLSGASQTVRVYSP